MKYPFLLAALALVLCYPLSVADTPGKYTVRARDFSHVYLCGPGVHPPDNRIENGVIHSKIQRGEDLYLVISCTIPSGGNPNGECGAGEESSLYWLHIHGNTVVKAQEILYDSCWKPIGGRIDGWKGQFLLVTYYAVVSDDANPPNSSSVMHQIVFNCKAPEKGLEEHADPPEKIPRTAG